MLTLLLSMIALAQPEPVGWNGFERDDLDDDGSLIVPDGAEREEGFVAGGEPVPQDETRWDGTVGIIFNGSQVGCTGTLVAPRVVMTAAHCLGGVTGVIIGAKNWYLESGNEGVEIIPIANAWGHPSYNGQRGADIAVLLLAQPSSYEPRAIATDCIRDEYLEDGAPVAVVGYGATRYNGRGYTTMLHYGFTAIQDYECRSDRIGGVVSGCDPALRPGGELGASSDGVDACFGDSGGPLFLVTDRGDYVAGVVSRAYLGVPRSEPCRYGGIYVRPDTYIDWMEQVTGQEVRHPQCNEPPVIMSYEDIRVRKNKMGTARVIATDPDGTDANVTYEIARRPEHGRATVDARGIVTYIPDQGFKGEDSVIVAAVDEGSAEYPRSGPAATEVELAIQVGGGFLGCSSIAAPSSTWLAGLGLLFAVGLRRRRQR
jgi:MYXO-CTERM domain-containing protein